MRTLQTMPTEELNITLNQIAKKYRSLDYVRHIYSEAFRTPFKVDYDKTEKDVEETKTFKVLYRKYAIDMTKLAILMFLNENLSADLRVKIDNNYTICPQVYQDFKNFMSRKSTLLSNQEFLNIFKNTKSDILIEVFLYFLDMVKEDLFTSGASFYALQYLNRVKLDGVIRQRPENSRLYVYYRDKVLSSVNKVEMKLLKDIGM